MLLRFPNSVDPCQLDAANFLMLRSKGSESCAVGDGLVRLANGNGNRNGLTFCSRFGQIC